uniref:Putative secreted peptide n=1 Tax=Anopheles braziliensis TaxID=58242 RepID=A0A2M3ZW18_9DIPT
MLILRYLFFAFSFLHYLNTSVECFSIATRLLRPMCTLLLIVQYTTMATRWLRFSIRFPTSLATYLLAWKNGAPAR